MAEDPPMVLRLRLLSDQPVEGCEIMPDVFLSNGASPTFANLDFRWYRCLDKMACTWCGKTPVVLQRLTDGAYFCSTGCFAAAWPGHPAQHSTGLAQRGPRHEGAENWSSSHGPQEHTTEQKWVEIANTMSYTPAQEDIGHTLKLVRAKWREGGGGRRGWVGVWADRREGFGGGGAGAVEEEEETAEGAGGRGQGGGGKGGERTAGVGKLVLLRQPSARPMFAARRRAHHTAPTVRRALQRR